MVVQHNLTAMNANRYFGINNSKLSKSLEKLSSGYAINRAGDNAAGLAVSEKMRSQIGGLTQAVKNAQDGISMVQTYEGALTETDSILQRMKVLATQSANGSYDDPIDRNAIEQEFLQLNDELDQIADTDFNGVVVLNGGTMADGVSADENGLIDYKAAADKAAAEAAAAAATKPEDLFADVKLDDSKYTNANAKELWTAMNIKDSDADYVDITFEATVDDTGVVTGWTAKSASIEGADLAGVTATATDNGGFTVDAAAANGATGATGIANAVVDTIGKKTGDTVTIRFNKPDFAENIAPTNIGFSDTTQDGGITVAGDFAGLTQDIANSATIELHANVGTNFNSATLATAQAYQDAISELDGAELSVKYTSDGNGTGNAGKVYSLNGTQLGATNANGWAITTGGVLTYKGQNIATFTAPDVANDATTENATATYKINIDGYNIAAAAAKPDANKEKAPGTSTEEEYEVSQSNAFSKSEAKMTYKKSITLQVGSRTKDAVDFTFQYKSTSMGDLKADLNCTAEGLGTDKLTLSTQEDANYAIDKIDQAINKVSMVRGTFGAIQNRLEHKIDNLNVTTENLTSAESRIRDTNMAEEMMNFTKQQILSQASQSMLAQANQLPQGVLSLLQ